MIHKLGYGAWDELKAAFRMSPLFRFDWFVKSRTVQELARRCDTLIRLVEKENQEFDERERQLRKEKKNAKVIAVIIAVIIVMPCQLKGKDQSKSDWIQTLLNGVMYQSTRETNSTTIAM